MPPMLKEAFNQFEHALDQQLRDKDIAHNDLPIPLPCRGVFFSISNYPMLVFIQQEQRQVEPSPHVSSCA
jgi:hypothetical protein